MLSINLRWLPVSVGLAVRFVMVAALVGSVGAAPIGTDGFTYPDGGIGEVTTVSADGWARNGTVKSDWNGSAAVVSQKLMTDGTLAWRAFGDPRATAAFQGDGVFFWRVLITYDGASEAVVSSSDFGVAKIDWGVIGATGTFGIEVRDASSSNTGVFSTVVAPLVGETYVLAGKLDFDSDHLLLWINPEPGSEATPLLSVAYDGDDWSSGVMLGSSADGSGVGWDDLEVGGTFADLNFPVVAPPFTLPDLTISEFMASNTQTVSDPGGSSPDWIEILNATGSAVDLAGWHLSDDPLDLTKWTFPPYILDHNSRLLVWASGKGRAGGAMDLHTNFKLRAGGEYLALVRPDDVTVVKEFAWGAAQAVARQYADVSYGTLGSAQAEGYFAIPTPGTANIESPFVAYSGTVLINEIVATSSGVAPSAGITDAGLPGAPAFSDWIELHNPGPSAVDISACRLSDDPQRRARWRFPDGTTIPAGGYLVVLADGVDTSGNYVHTNFSLAGGGGYLGLYDPNGVLLDDFSTGYPQQIAGLSYGHQGYFEIPTPGAENGANPLDGIVAAPVFSIPAGFHDSPLTTLVSSATPAAAVHTEVGSALPDRSSPTTAMFSSTAGQVLSIRARAYAPGMVPSPIVSATYIMNASAAERSLPAMHFIGDDYATFWDPAGGGSALGIIDNYEMRGRLWERPINLELHFPDGAPSQALGAGLRYAGHGDRPEFFREMDLWDYPYARPQFNLFFRSEYGASTWEHDLFSGLADVIRHDSLRVRLDRGLVDEFIRRSWVGMGNFGSVGTLTNLYVNGNLRTVVNPVQRIREPLLQEWYGTGNQFDVLAVFDFPSGDEFEYAALEDFFEDAGNDFTHLGKYMEGGELLDYVNFVDYMLLHSYMATTDWPENNKHAARERVAGGKFRFYVWDAQQSMADGGAPPATEATIDRLMTADDTTVKILSAVKGSEEFRLLWADRIQKHFFNGGALTNAEMDARWFPLSSAINPIFKQFWGSEIDDSLYTSWRDTRLPHALANYESHGLWFGDLLAPALSQLGGSVDAHSAVTVYNPTTDPQFTAMSIYYTMDGTDPRVPGGAVNPAAMIAPASALVFGAGETALCARVYDATTNRWSPCSQASFHFIGSTIPLVAAELFYNPPGSSEGEEFIELLNISKAETIDLSGFQFTAGISFTFPAGSLVPPGGRIVVAKDIIKFTERYGIPPVGVLFGPYGGALANGGERIVLSAPDGVRVIDFSYDDRPPWPQLADGGGVSLEFVSPEGNPDGTLATNWADGCQPAGSPGYADVIDYDGWKLEHGVVDDGGDLTRLLEYAFGTDARSANDLPVATVGGGGNFLTIEFRRNLAAKDVLYTVEVSDDLSVWLSGSDETLALGSVRNGDGTSTESHRCVAPIGTSRRKFIRVRVDLVP